MNEWDDTTCVATGPIAVDDETDRGDQAYLVVIAGSNVGTMHKIDSDLTVLGRSMDANIRLLDDGISRHHCRIRMEGGQLCVEDLNSRNGTFCNGERTAFRVLEDGDKLQIGQTTILKFSYQDYLDENFQKQMLDSALRDSLTGTYNKRYFTDRLDSEIKFSLRHQVNLALMIMDLDFFKDVNDTFGHLAGDKVLTCFAGAIQRSIRNEDVLARYGGEEFGLIVRSINRENIMLLGNRLCNEISEMYVEWEGRRIPVTVSIGIATIPENEINTPLDFIKAADSMLYEAKKTGRNRAVMAPEGGL